MKVLVFDSSALISLTINNLLNKLRELKKHYRGEFYITNEVEKEIVSTPINNKKFKLEALQIANFIANDNLKVYEEDLSNKTNYLLTLANSIYKAQDNYIQILQKGEVESLALASIINADALVIDERTTRLLIEDALKLKHLLEHKLHTKVTIDKDNLLYFKKETRNVKIIRSSELMIIAFELNLFENYDKVKNIIKDYKKELLEGVLYGLRFNGCSISIDEINNVLRF